MEPLVTIGLLCFNQAEYVVETLESIKHQTYKNIELIIVDDCSSDDSVAVIYNWLSNNNLTCIFCPKPVNLGVCAAVNSVLESATGKYISLIASDDTMLAEKISSQVRILECAAENIAFVYSDANVIDEKSKDANQRFIALCRGPGFFPGGDIYAELVVDNFIPIMSCLFRKDIFNVIGRFDTNLSYEDYDFLLRATVIYDVVFSDFVSVNYRVHSTNATKKILSDTGLRSSFTLLSKQLGARDGKYDTVLQRKLIAILQELHKRKSKDVKKLMAIYSTYFKDNRILKFSINTGLPYSLVLTISKPAQIMRGLMNRSLSKASARNN